MPEGHDRRPTATRLTLAAAELPVALGPAATALALLGLLTDRSLLKGAGATSLCFNGHDQAILGLRLRRADSRVGLTVLFC